MPFLEYDPREHEVYKDVTIPRNVLVPTTDAAAWWFNQDYSYIYNKLDLAMSQGLEAGPIGVDPDSFPVFLKPLMNLWGGGHSSRKINSQKELEEHAAPGLFWMPLLKGEHLSHDFALEDGKVVYYMAMEGKPIGEGMFDYWAMVQPDRKLVNNLTKWIEKTLPEYTGLANLETIGGKIIEGHLRWGDSWLSGDADLAQSVVSLYAGKGWKYKGQPDEFFVFPIWGDPNIRYKLPKDAVNAFEDSALIGDLEHEAEGPTPIGGTRLALFSIANKSDGLALRKQTTSAFKPRISKKWTEKLS